MAAVRLCLDRIAPRPKDTAIDFELPALQSAESALSAVADIAAALGRGELTPAQANDLTRVVERFLRAHENVVLEQRVKRLEARIRNGARGWPPAIDTPLEFMPADATDGARAPEPGSD